MSRRANALTVLLFVFWVAGCQSNTKPDSSQSENTPIADASLEKRANEIVAELHARVPKRAADRKNKLPRHPASDAVSEIGPTFAPQEASAPLDPRFAGASSQNLYKELQQLQLQIQAHWMDTEGRQEWFEAAPILQRDSRKVVSLVHSGQLTASAAGGHSLYQLKAESFSTFRYVDHGVAYPLCADEPYLKQPMGAFCSGVLVGENIVATAAHCIASDDEAKKTKFVFDFRMNDRDHPQSSFDDTEVFSGKRIIQQHSSFTQDDWELVELETNVSDQTRIAQIRRNGKLDQSKKVFAIGFPTGLPVKVSAGGSVRDNTDSKIFLAGIDVYAGNSGGPVFNDQHVVEGILARGDKDFLPVGNCAKTNNCPSAGCPGDAITRTTQFSQFVP
jgi:S1-C subfamily serine protease